MQSNEDGFGVRLDSMEMIDESLRARHRPRFGVEPWQRFAYFSCIKNHKRNTRLEHLVGFDRNSEQVRLALLDKLSQPPRTQLLGEPITKDSRRKKAI
jgi:hypothetical protein